VRGSSFSDHFSVSAIIRSVEPVNVCSRLASRTGARLWRIRWRIAIFAESSLSIEREGCRQIPVHGWRVLRQYSGDVAFGAGNWWLEGSEGSDELDPINAGTQIRCFGSGAARKFQPPFRYVAGQRNWLAAPCAVGAEGQIRVSRSGPLLRLRAAEVVADYGIDMIEIGRRRQAFSSSVGSAADVRRRCCICRRSRRERVGRTHESVRIRRPEPIEPGIA
jgi:hypothetical protein